MATSLSILKIIDNDWTEIALPLSLCNAKSPSIENRMIIINTYMKNELLLFLFCSLDFCFWEEKKEFIPKKCCVFIWKAHCPYIKLYFVENVKFKNNSRKDAKARKLPYKYRWYNGWRMKERGLVVEWQRLHRRWCVQFERKRQL